VADQFNLKSQQVVGCSWGYGLLVYAVFSQYGWWGVRLAVIASIWFDDPATCCE